MDSNATTPLLRNPVEHADFSGGADGDEDEVTRATLTDMATWQFYGRERWFDEMCEGLFKIRNRRTTVWNEIYYGLVHYVSCLFCLAVIPSQMSQAGYDKSGVFVSTAICCGVGSIICGLFANLPFVIAPPAAVAIFLSVYLQNYKAYIGSDSLPHVGSVAVMISGVLLMLLGYRPFGNFVSRLIPTNIQAGTAVGIGLVTALAGAVDIDLVVEGRFNVLLRMGVITWEVVIAFAGVVIICVATHYHLKGAFCIAIIVCSLSWGVYSGDWPEAVVSVPHTTKCSMSDLRDSRVPVLIADLVFLYILYLNGLISSLSLIANLNRKDGSTPRGRWIFILTGAMTCISGYLSGAPVLISPESAAGIKDGAKTGLSALVCGVLFLFSVFFSPLFDAIPKAGTSPILLMIGALLFQNTVRIDWTDITKATPAFVVLFFIPFTYSVIQGVLLGYSVYLLVGLFTGDLYTNAVIMCHVYLPISLAKKYLPQDPRSGLRTVSLDDDALLRKGINSDAVMDECGGRYHSHAASTTTHSRAVSDIASNESKEKAGSSVSEAFGGIGFIDPHSPHMTQATTRARKASVDCLVFSPDDSGNGTATQSSSFDIDAGAGNTQDPPTAPISRKHSRKMSTGGASSKESSVSSSPIDPGLPVPHGQGFRTEESKAVGETVHGPQSVEEGITSLHDFALISIIFVCYVGLYGSVQR
jgi:AGZA family xanthine/uracil permease-like MFS transporter